MDIKTIEAIHISFYLAHDERVHVNLDAGQNVIDIEHKGTAVMRRGQWWAGDKTRGQKIFPTHELAVESTLKYLAKKVGEGFLYMGRHSYIQTAGQERRILKQEEFEELIKDFPQTGKGIKNMYDPTVIGQKTAFITAVRKGNIAKVKQVMEDGIDIHGLQVKRKSDGKDYRYPVIEAVIYKQKEVLASLLEHLDSYIFGGGSYCSDSGSHFSSSYLTIIACSDYWNMLDKETYKLSEEQSNDAKVNFLLESGYDLAKDPCIFTKYNRFKISPELRKKILDGADLTYDTGDAAFLASETHWGKPTDPELMRELIDRGISLNPTPQTHKHFIKTYKTPLALAKESYSGHPDIIQLFIDKGAL